jgi:glycosyltransferase involved in cell wall biosynthesis
MPSVSVVMPAYNVERYLAESIDSVLAQTFRDFELVIVDDGSTDGSYAIAERYRTKHPERIVLVSQENRGLAGARNTALRAASGRVFALLDSDDGWHPQFLESQMRLLDTHPDVAIVSGNALNRGGIEDGRPAQPVPDPRPAPDLVSILADETAVFIMSLFRREVVDRIGGFDEDFRTNEDYDFWIRAGLAGFKFLRNPEPLGFYRRHANSLSASDVRMLTGILRVYHKALPHCPPGTPGADVIAAQISRFETELLAANAREALGTGDMRKALAAVEGLRARRGGLALRLFAEFLQHMPRVATWVYQARARLRGAPR